MNRRGFFGLIAGAIAAPKAAEAEFRVPIVIENQRGFWDSMKRVVPLNPGMLRDADADFLRMAHQGSLELLHHNIHAVVHAPYGEEF